jgi:phosphomannomutase
MKSSHAVIGGEGSNGGIIFPSVQYCRDSYTGMAFLLDRLAETGRPLSELAGTLPRYHRLLDKAPFEHGRLGPLMQSLQRQYPTAVVDRSDGLKLSMKDAWIHVRASNTEPLLRYAVESRSRDQLAELAATVRNLVERRSS